MLRLATNALDRPRRWLAVTAVLTAACAWGLGDLRLRTDGAALRPSGNPTVARTDRVWELGWTLASFASSPFCCAAAHEGRGRWRR